MGAGELSLALADERATEALGEALATACAGSEVLHLQGELGAGKTTLARGFLRALGYAGRVKSPTYSLLETYDVAGGRAYHLDLYRLADPGETEWLGLDELEREPGVVLVEWPERGAGGIPGPDLTVALAHASRGRRAKLTAHGAGGQRLLEAASSLTH